jgi:predicted ATPase
VLAGTRTQPLVLAFEDLHWADPTSLDVLQALAERGAHAPLLIKRRLGPNSARPRSSDRIMALSRSRRAMPCRRA